MLQETEPGVSHFFCFYQGETDASWLTTLSIPSSPDIQHQVMDCIEILLAYVITGVLGNTSLLELHAVL
jgi:hypothetical protein